jgi:hypothetical protein
VKEEKRDRETKEREEVDHSRKREKEKERRREKRQTSPPAESFEADLSSVSNSSNGSIHQTADLVIVDDQRGLFKCKVALDVNLPVFLHFLRTETS